MEGERVLRGRTGREWRRYHAKTVCRSVVLGWALQFFFFSFVVLLVFTFVTELCGIGTCACDGEAGG
jgi:hypothetical protein